MNRKLIIYMLFLSLLSPVMAETLYQQDSFPYPKIPSVIRNPEERKAFLLCNYWSDFDFSNRMLIDNRNVGEQGFVNFISLLADEHTSQALIVQSMEAFCKGLLSDTYARKAITGWMDDYLYNPNSPFYNEALYEAYLETLLDVLPPDDAQRSTCDFRLKLVNRNNPGDQATDFAYYLPDGTRRTLAATPVRNNRLLLLFYDPECESCHEVLLRMAADAALSEAVRTGKLGVLAVYTEGNDEAWRKALPDMPEGWTVGTDREAVKTGALYDLKAMPSLYLLDGQKRVLLKDAAYEAVRQSLHF